MPNSYYNHGTYPTPNSPGSSGQLRSELDSITAGFAKLPTLTGNGNKIVRVNAAGTLLESVLSVPVANGGTGLTSYAVNGALYADGFGTTLLTGTLPVLSGGTGQTSFTINGALFANGTGTAISSGTLPVLSGGTGQTSFTINGALFANGTGTAISSGTLPVASGGTGGNTAVLARGNILPAYAGNQNKALTVNSTGTDVEYSLFNLASVTGVLPVINGGTNASTAPGARTNLLPAYTGKAGYALVINGSETDVEFLPAPGIGLPVQANEGGTGLTDPGTAGNVLVSTGTGWTSLSSNLVGTSTAKTYFMAQF